METIKLTTEVPREKILAIIYASYFLGYEHHAKQLLLTHPESVETRRFLNSLVDKVYEKEPKQERYTGVEVVVCPIHGNVEYDVKPTHFCGYKINRVCNCVCTCKTKPDKKNRI